MAKILLVEDEINLRDLYTEILMDAGYEVVSVADGEAALEHIKNTSWDLLLLDIMLPRMDGLSVLKAIRSNTTLSSKPVLVMSNLEETAIIDECLMLGAQGFLIKSSTTPADLLTAVENRLPDV